MDAIHGRWRHLETPDPEGIEHKQKKNMITYTQILYQIVITAKDRKATMIEYLKNHLRQ